MPDWIPPDHAQVVAAPVRVETASLCDPAVASGTAMPTPETLAESEYNSAHSASSQAYGNTALAEAEARQAEYRPVTKRSSNLLRKLLDRLTGDYQWMVDGDQADDPNPASDTKQADLATPECKTKSSSASEPRGSER